MIQINPLKSYIDGGVRAAITTPPSASLVFDLPGKAIWVKGVKLKGTDHTYTFSHDNYITLTNTPDSNESEDIKIGVNTSALKSAIDTTYGVVSTTANGLAPKFTSGNKLAASAATTYYFLGWTGTTLKWYQAPFRNIRINSETIDRLGVNSTDPLIISSGNGISVTWDSTNKKIVITNTKPDVNHNTDRTGIKLATVSGTKKTDSTLILANSTTGLSIQGGTNKFLIGNGTNYIEVPIVPSFTISNKDATIGTALTTIATIAGVDIKAKIASYSLSNHTHSVKINGSTKTIAASGAVDLGNYLPLSGGTMGGTAWIKWSDSGNWSNNNSDVTFPVIRGGLQWSGLSDYVKLFSEETSSDNLNLVLQFGDDNSNGLSIKNASNIQTSYISAGGVITTGTFKGNLDWSYITNKPSSYTPSAHTHAWNSLTHSSTTENQAILTNGSANGWKLYTLNISGWNNAANNAHSHSNKSVLDDITSALINNWNTAYNFVNTISGTDTDKVINKWDEIVNFLAGITEDNKLNTLLNSKLSILLLSAKDILTTKTNNALFWVNTIGTASSITTGPFTDHPYALLSITNYNLNTENSKFFYRSRLAFSSTGDIKVASCHHENVYKLDETWYNVLTSKNSGISGSTIKLNGTSITVYSSSTADSRYVKKTGDTMSGVLTIDTTGFGALTIKRNDDANGTSIQFRGKSNVYGYIGLNNSTKDKLFLRWNSDTSKTYIILDTSSTYVSGGKGIINSTTITQVDNATNATNSTNSTNARKLINWYPTRPTSLNTQFGDGSLRIFYATSSTTEGKSPSDATVLHLAWDNNGGWDTQLGISPPSGRVYSRAQNSGTWQSWKTLAFTTDIPTALKNPYALTISLNGASQGPYDGSAAKNINITPSSIGASPSSHTHAYLPLSGGTMTGGITFSNSSHLLWNSGSYHLRILLTDDSTADTAVFTFLQSSDSGTNWSNLMTIRDNGKVIANTFVGSLLGNASTASKWSTARTLSLTGSITGSVSFDGSGNIILNTTTNHSHSLYLPLAGGIMTGNITYKGKGTSYIGNGENDAANGVGGALNNLVISSWNGISFTTSCGGQTYTNKNAVSINCRNGYVYANTFVGAFSGNASTATKLTSSAGNATLPIYFSDGKPVACVASSVFSNLSNNGNNISVTVAGQNRTLTVGYANNAAIATRLKVYTEVSNNTNVYRIIGQQTLNSGWTNRGLVLAVASRHSGVGIYIIHYGAEVSNGYYADRNLSNTDSYYTFSNVYCKIRYFGDTHDISNSKIICHVKPASGDNPKSAVFTFFLHSNDNSSPRISILQDWGSPFELIENGVTMSTIDTSVYGELKESTVMNESNLCTGNSVTATTLQTVRTLWGQSFNGSANVSGNMSSVGLITFSTLSGTNGRALLYLQMADNDYFRIYAGGTASNSGYVEIATADEGNEPIYVRQYTGVFSTLKRTLTLLDASGNTILPGFATAIGFNKSGSSNSYVLLGGGSHKLVSDFATSAQGVGTIISISKSLTPTTSWIDTGIKTDSATFPGGNGSYIVQISVPSSSGTDGWGDLYTGYFSLFTGTDSSTEDEILLHGASHALLKRIYLKTKATKNTDGTMHFYIASEKAFSAARTINFKFRKLI